MEPSDDWFLKGNGVIDICDSSSCDATDEDTDTVHVLSPVVRYFSYVRQPHRLSNTRWAKPSLSLKKPRVDPKFQLKMHHAFDSNILAKARSQYKNNRYQRLANGAIQKTTVWFSDLEVFGELKTGDHVHHDQHIKFKPEWNRETWELYNVNKF